MEFIQWVVLSLYFMILILHCKYAFNFSCIIQKRFKIKKNYLFYYNEYKNYILLSFEIDNSTMFSYIVIGKPDSFVNPPGLLYKNG